jgi:hypothetical protein
MLSPQQRERIAELYIHGLETGDIDLVSQALTWAEQDPLLDVMLEDIDLAYAHELGIQDTYPVWLRKLCLSGTIWLGSAGRFV